MAPIVLFVYNRVTHTRRTIEALQNNKLAGDSDLFIFSDGAGNPNQVAAVSEVRRYVTTITGFRSVSVIERANNFGLASNIIDGVSTVVDQYHKAIVLEDDLVSSPYFLQFMNEALTRYEDEHRVACIHSYVYPVREKLPETFFLKGADCWGWATWKRGWDLFEANGQILLDGLKEKNLTREFDLDGAYPYTSMLSDQIKGINNSWAIRWHASAYVNDKLTLYPGRSLVQNTGNDGTGIHSGSSSVYDVSLSPTPVTLAEIPVEENPYCRKAYVNFFRSIKPGLIQRTFTKLKIMARHVITKKTTTSL